MIDVTPSFPPIVNITGKLLLNIPFFNMMCTTTFYIKSSKSSVQQDFCVSYCRCCVVPWDLLCAYASFLIIVSTTVSLSQTACATD